MLLQKFLDYIQQQKLFNPGTTVLVAVSGGVDSVVLCELCHYAGIRFVMAHCNFQLRGNESMRDEDFVKTLAQKYQAPVLVKKFDTASIAAQQKKSIETTARDLRYQWFNELITHPKSDSVSNPAPPTLILTAHHADDNIETAVMHFFRGTGIAGVRGMLPKQGKIIRPLLFARRLEIEAFAANNSLVFVTDSSNHHTDFTRNLFRNKILPLVNEVYPEASENILHNIHRFTETEQLYRQAVEQHKKKVLKQKGNEFFIAVRQLQKLTPLHTLLYEWLKDFNFTPAQTGDAIRLLQAETGKYIVSPTHRLLKNRNWLIITPLQQNPAVHILIEENDSKVYFDSGVLKIEKSPWAMSHIITGSKNKAALLDTSPYTAQLDADEITFPLLLRQWKQGDYFYPLGMQKKKKISRFLIDQKIPLHQKEKVWVIEMNKKILWVVGLRIDDRFKIRPSTMQKLQIKWVKSEDAPVA